MSKILIILLLITASYSSFALESLMNRSKTMEIRKSYEVEKAKLESYRLKLGKLLKKRGADKEKSILIKAERLLEHFIVNTVFPAWHYTRWDFNGTAKIPGEGKIACGYFVSAVLIDVGFKVNRVKLSQRPSGLIIKTFSPKKYIYREVGTDYLDYFVNLEEKLKDGLYIVGLDSHTGFILIRNGKRIFTHSNSYVFARYVVSQDIDEVFTHLMVSNWKEVGKLFTDSMLRKWLKGETFEVRMKK